MKKINNAIGQQLKERSGEKNKIPPLFAFFSLMLGCFIASEVFAYYCQYQVVLGASFYHLYSPFSIIKWGYQWGLLDTVAFKAATGMGVMTSCVLLLGCLFMKNKEGAGVSGVLHGSARWADETDIKRAGLLDNNEGVYVGAWQDKKGTIHYLRHNGPEHVLTYAPTRSGKGVGLVLPTLLSWPHSAFITDLKGELWAMTAGWRQHYAKNKVIRFEPASNNGSARFNPLDTIRIDSDYEVGDAQNIATLIVDPDGKGLITHWQKTSQSLLVGLIMHVLYLSYHEGTPKTLPYIDFLLADPTRPINDLFLEMMKYPHKDGKNHPAVGRAARDMVDRAAEEAGSILSTLKSFLALYRDPVVADNVSVSDFSIKDLMHHASPVSLYIVTQPNDKLRLQPLVRLIISLVVRILADDMVFEQVDIPLTKTQAFLKKWGLISFTPKKYVRTKKTYQHRLLGMIDEFPSLGKLEILQESLAFVAGYGIKFYLICQDINQLKSRETGYGQDETITSNCHIQNAYPPNRVETAEHLSKLTGQTTIVKENITTSGRNGSLFLTQISKNQQEIQRPLLTVDECLRMPSPIKNKEGQIVEAGDMLIYVAGYPAIYGKQPLYFKDALFVERAAIKAPEVSDILCLHSFDNKAIEL